MIVEECWRLFRASSLCVPQICPRYLWRTANVLLYCMYMVKEGPDRVPRLSACMTAITRKWTTRKPIGGTEHEEMRNKNTTVLIVLPRSPVAGWTER